MDSTRCPISLDLLEDPVTLCTGQTYDRSCIQKWLSAGNLTCPVTMQKLRYLSMVPNRTLRHLIHHWLRSCNTQLNSPRTRLSIAGIKRMEKDSDASTLEDKLQLLETVHSLNNSLLIKLDFFGLVLELLFRNAHNLLLVEKALLCALKMTPFSLVDYRSRRRWMSGKINGRVCQICESPLTQTPSFGALES